LLEAGAGFDAGHQHRDHEDELALVGIETALGFEDRSFTQPISILRAALPSS